MNRAVMALLLVIVPAMATLGQGQPHGGQMGDPKERLEQRMEKLEKELSLSDAQAVAIQSIHQELFESMRAMRSSGLERSEMRQSMRKLRDEAEAEVISLLDDEQAEKYEELRKQEREEMQKRMRERQEGGGRPPGAV